MPPFQEAWAWLEKCGLVDELANWHDLAHGKGSASDAVN
jgi:hypothetical protein